MYVLDSDELLLTYDNSGSSCSEVEGNDLDQLEEKILNQLKKWKK